MSKDELDPQKIMSKLQNWKEQVFMIKGRADSQMGDAVSAFVGNVAQEMQIILGENQRLKSQLDDALKQIPSKELPKSETAPKKK